LRDDAGGNLLLKLVYKLYTVVPCFLSLAIMLAREDTEVHIHACNTKTEHFWPAVCANFYLEKLHHSLEKTSGQ